MDSVTFRTLLARQSTSNSTHGGNQQIQTTQQKPCLCKKRHCVYVRGECSQGRKLPGSSVLWDLKIRGSFKDSPPLLTKYKYASTTHRIWKVLMDNNTINFQSFSSLWEEGKYTTKATSAMSVPNQGQNADTILRHQQHYCIMGFLSPPHFSQC